MRSLAAALGAGVVWGVFGEVLLAGWAYDGSTGMWLASSRPPDPFADWENNAAGHRRMLRATETGGTWVDPGWGGTPGWRISLIFTIFVVLSFAIEKGLHAAERRIREVGYKGLLHTMRKVEEELLILGFLSLLLTAFSSFLVRICVDCGAYGCKVDAATEADAVESAAHARALLGRALLSATDACSNPCPAGKEPFWSAEALHQTHLFVFILAIIFILYSATSMVLGWLRVGTWRGWEKEAVDKCVTEDLLPPKSLVVPEDWDGEDCIAICEANEERSSVTLLLTDFANQFFRSVSTGRYINLRRAFVERSRLDSNFDFVTYVNTSIQEDFALIVGLDWLLWLIAAVWIALDSPDGMVNIYIYFWMPALAMVAQLMVGTKIMSMSRTLEENSFLYFTARKTRGLAQWQAANRLSRTASQAKLLTDLEHSGSRAIEQKSTLTRVSTMRGSDMETATRLGLDASEVLFVQFWFDRNILFIYIFQFIMFVNVFIISMLIFSAWQGLTDTLVFNGMPWWSVIIVVVVQLLLVFHAAWFILPVYILVTCAGSKYNSRFLGQTVRRSGGGILGLLGFRKDAHKKALERGKQSIMIRDINAIKEGEGFGLPAPQASALESLQVLATVKEPASPGPVYVAGAAADVLPAEPTANESRRVSVEAAEAPVANIASVSTWHAHSRAGSGLGLTSFAEIRAQALAATRNERLFALDQNNEENVLVSVGDDVLGMDPAPSAPDSSEACLAPPPVTTALDDFRAAGEQVTIGRTSAARRLLSTLRESRPPPQGTPIIEEDESAGTPVQRTTSAAESRQSVRDIFGPRTP